MKTFAFLIAPLALVACDNGSATPEAAPADEATTSVERPAQQSVPAAATAPAANVVGCSANETPIFACTLANGKSLAVCAPGENAAEYRYGGGTLELQLEGGEFANVMYSGGGESQIAFANGDYRYIVFSRMVRTNFTAGEPNNPAMSDGVIVLQGDRFVSMQLCDGQGGGIDVNYADAEWQRQDELFTLETGRADSEVLP